MRDVSQLIKVIVALESKSTDTTTLSTMAYNMLRERGHSDFTSKIIIWALRKKVSLFS